MHHIAQADFAVFFYDGAVFGALQLGENALLCAAAG
jgi:hypothetical protein